MKTMWHYAAIMALSGMGIPVLAALNAALGRHMQAPVAAAAILFLVAFAACALGVLLTNPSALPRAAGAPWHYFTAGLLVAFYIVAITIIAPRFGLGNAIFFVLLGQMVSAAAIDHFGLFSARVSPLGPVRLAGLGMMALGVWMTLQK